MWRQDLLICPRYPSLFLTSTPMLVLATLLLNLLHQFLFGHLGSLLGRPFHRDIFDLRLRLSLRLRPVGVVVSLVRVIVIVLLRVVWPGFPSVF